MSQKVGWSRYSLPERCKDLLRDAEILWLGLEGDDATVWEVFEVLHRRVTVVAPAWTRTAKAHPMCGPAPKQVGQ